MYRTGDLTNDPWISSLVPLVLYINITWTSSRTFSVGTDPLYLSDVPMKVSKHQ